MDSPEIKPGQIWETRSGHRIQIEQILENHGMTPVRSGEQHWQLNGRYWADHIDHSNDLIKLIS